MQGTLRERESFGHGPRLELVSVQISNWKVSALVWKKGLLKCCSRGGIVVWESFPAGPIEEPTLRSSAPLPRIYAAGLWVVGLNVLEDSREVTSIL